ncbi:TPA: TonB-dependent receptor domain-containing protein [Flavobacterium psychrophilum]|uniref:outer membrane beta-barrel family protein n=2 Tax=Flavobacterium psychrophilum TaxID=96345 RepID=UPI000B7C491D|nr:outer membrane beta-barrel family protein [Flavobacterium psychrophilum]SNB96519.1 putative TonB-dependent outer membrane receptor [Flavobacterium psychrophilum]GEJ34478.1 TonB-dependent receptor [Flavobacterium psychrophilum]GEJ34656.1 TonB-dependent receptor [Flavobacterium psychrophilum]GEJ36900.1 TonB-dependent receptor [Flavobacterium psychrophilum]GEJ41320.1 TonB-dependent receptor [Flavobacterium psychrophilum]
MKKALIILFGLMISNLALAQNEVKQDTISKKLEEVIIKTEKKVFTNKNGNLKVDVANSILKSVPNTIDLVSKLPNVIIDANKETINIIGKGNPLLYIDNQKVSINDLNALSVDEIKSIEIINNPSAKYEAEGRVVILIARKLSKKEGFKIDLTETASVKKRFNNYVGINASIKKKKLEIKANFNYNQLTIWEGHDIKYEIPEENIISNYDVEAYTKRPQFIFGSGLFYKINEDDYFSMSGNARVQKDIFGINTKTFNKQNTIENNILTQSSNDNNRVYINLFANYAKKIKSINTQFFSGFQFSNFNQKMVTLVENSYNNISFEQAQNRNQQFNVSVISGRTDLEKTFKNEIKLEIGGLFLSANAKTNSDISNLINLTLATSKYNFKEQNISGYSQVSGKIKKVQYSAGFRIENTNIIGKYTNEILPLIKKDYTNFFPKVQLDIPLDSSKTITLNYAKSITRPNYSATNQGSTYINPYFIYGSNINLDPTINDEIAANFQYNDKSIRLRYYKNSNPVYGNFKYDNFQNILTFSEKNFDKEMGLEIDFTIPFTYKFWTVNNSLSFILNKIEDKLALQKESKPYMYYYSNHVFKLPKEYTISTTVWGLTTQHEGVFERKQPNFLIDLAISKKFLKQWDCTLSFNDIFKNFVYKENFTVNKVSSKSHYLSDTHEISLAIRYSFGKIKDSEFKEKSINDNENRIR